MSLPSAQRYALYEAKDRWFIPRPSGVIAAAVKLKYRNTHRIRDRTKKRDFNTRSFPSALTLEQRLQDGVKCRHTCCDIARRDANPSWVMRKVRSPLAL